MSAMANRLAALAALTLAALAALTPPPYSTCTWAAPSAQGGADGAVDFLGLLGAGAAAGADGPDRLIGQDHARHGFGAQGQHGLELALDDGQRVAGVAIGQRFAHADHGSQAGGQRGARLVRHDLVGLAVQHATLGVAGQGPAAAEFLQHRAGDFARVGALFLSADILRAP